MWGFAWNDYDIIKSMKDKFKMSVEQNIFLAKKILVENIYNTAKIEGVNTTFPETEAILSGVNVPTATLDEIRVITNLRDAWRFVLSDIKSAKIDLGFMLKINENVSRNESIAWGVLRDGMVGIAGTKHKPPIPNEKTVALQIGKILKNETVSATEKAIDLMLFTIYNQLFWDGNKRAALITANAVLVQNGCGILSVAEGDIVEFNKLLKNYYDTGVGDELKQFLYSKAVIDFATENETINETIKPIENTPLNKTEIAVLAMISKNPFVTYEELAKSVKRNRSTVSRAVAELKSRKIISRVGSNKNGSWVVSRD